MKQGDQLTAGIDVSKSSLDVYYNDAQQGEHCLRVANNVEGYRLIKATLGLERIYVVENTGPYYLKLAFFLKQLGADIRVENPIRVKRFIEMNMERNKSDQKDARWIYRYARQRVVKPWKLPSKLQMECQQLISAIDMYIRQLTMIKNQLHSLEQLPHKCKGTSRSLHLVQKTLQGQQERLEEQLQCRLEKWQAGQLRSLHSIPGLGKRAAALLIVYTDGFTKVVNYKQLTALAGLSPREHTSGSSIKGKKGICKMGSGRLRSVLYMCSVAAIRCNSACKELYQRLKMKGKPGKVALVAVCNKLLKQAFAIATKETLYQQQHQSVKL
jgi:transposase